MTALTLMTSLTLNRSLSSNRPRAFAFWKRRTAPEIPFRGLSSPHGLFALRARGRGLGVALFLAGFEPSGRQAFAEAAALLESLALRGDLAFEHVQRSSEDDQHRVRHHHGVGGVQPEGVFAPLLQRMLRGLMHHVIGKRGRVQRDGVHGFCFR